MTSSRLDIAGASPNKLLAIVGDSRKLSMLLTNRRWAAPRLRKSLSRFPALLLFALIASGPTAIADSGSQATPGAKVRLAIVGLNHDHVWGILKDIEAEKNSELVAIAETDQNLVSRAKGRVPPSVRF